jgi:hypothetical protein
VEVALIILASSIAAAALATAPARSRLPSEATSAARQERPSAPATLGRAPCSLPPYRIVGTRRDIDNEDGRSMSVIIALRFRAGATPVPG